jgi:hypothetical protein
VARFSRTGGLSNGTGSPNRASIISFFDTANSTLTAAVGGLRNNAGSDYNGSLAFYVNNTGGTNATSVSQLTEAMRVANTGNIGIGTASPAERLEIYGNLKLSTGSAGSVIFPDGSTQSTAWTGSLCGGDYAESVGVSGDRTRYEPGDVLVISSGDSDDMSKSSEPYSSLVAGIYSTKPGLVGKRSTEPEQLKKQIPMAMVGIVPVKVTSENGAIRKGDMLVTSSMPGYAMRGTDHARMLGAVIGKALEPFNSDKGLIDVLVSLQ